LNVTTPGGLTLSLLGDLNLERVGVGIMVNP
jgi:hypothetical protein